MAFALVTARPCDPQTPDHVYHLVPWRDYAPETDSALGMAVAHAAPMIDPVRWGFRFARVNLRGHPLVLVRARISGGTGGGEDAFYILEPTAGGRFRRTWGAMARYYQAPWGLPEIPTFTLDGCLFIDVEQTLGYSLLPDTSHAARQFLAQHEEDYVPEEHLTRQAGVYATDERGRVRYVSPPDPQLVQQCRDVPTR